jgi:hypothetical protein
VKFTRYRDPRARGFEEADTNCPFPLRGSYIGIRRIVQRFSARRKYCKNITLRLPAMEPGLPKPLGPHKNRKKKASQFAAAEAACVGGTSVSVVVAVAR